MTVPSGADGRPFGRGLDAAATSWNNGKAYTGAIDPIALALHARESAEGRLSDPVGAGAAQPYAYGVPNVTLIGTSHADRRPGNRHRWNTS